MPRKVVLNGVVTILAIALGILLTFEPWHYSYQTSRKIQEERLNLAREMERRDGELRRMAKDQSQPGREQLARDKGWYIQGEKRLELQGQ